MGARLAGAPAVQPRAAAGERPPPGRDAGAQGSDALWCVRGPDGRCARAGRAWQTSWPRPARRTPSWTCTRWSATCSTGSRRTRASTSWSCTSCCPCSRRGPAPGPAGPPPPPPPSRPVPPVSFARGAIDARASALAAPCHALLRPGTGWSGGGAAAHVSRGAASVPAAEHSSGAACSQVRMLARAGSASRRTGCALQRACRQPVAAQAATPRPARRRRARRPPCGRASRTCRSSTRSRSTPSRAGRRCARSRWTLCRRRGSTAARRTAWRPRCCRRGPPAPSAACALRRSRAARRPGASVCAAQLADRAVLGLCRGPQGRRHALLALVDSMQATRRARPA